MKARQIVLRYQHEQVVLEVEIDVMRSYRQARSPIGDGRARVPRGLRRLLGARMLGDRADPDKHTEGKRPRSCP